MKVFFTGTKDPNSKHYTYYKKILDILIKSSIEVTSVETEPYYDLLNKDLIRDKPQDEVHYMYTKKGMSRASAIIIEATEDDFRVGHEATLALLYNKPVLCLSRDKDYSQYIKHPKFYSKKYRTEEDLEKIIKSFLKEMKNKYLSVRFNGFLSPEQKNFLEWYGSKSGKNISEVLRDLIDEKMTQNPDYYEDTVY